MERSAARVLAGRLEGRINWRDVPNAGNGMHDFDVVGSSGKVLAAVEVSSIQEPAVRATRAKIVTTNRLDLGLTTGWQITVGEQQRIQPIVDGVAPILNGLAEMGIARFSGPQALENPAAQRLVRGAGALGIVEGHVLADAKPARLVLSVAGATEVNMNELTNAVERELLRPDNRRKLGAAPIGTERHLFVWAHSSRWDLVRVLLDPAYGLPPAAELPPEVDTVWFAASLEAPEKLTPARLLTAHRRDGGAWQEALRPVPRHG